ncbi:MAG: trehalose-6-phosphate synthase [Acidobacteria bacterium]|nr:trehalose-6-phosphate synthase [Acidobacteriota bacterium]
MHDLRRTGKTGLEAGRSFDAVPPRADSGRVIVLANRQPFSHEHRPDGQIVVKRSTSGLVTASEPLVRQTAGVWVAHGAGSADRAVVDAWDGVMVPPDDPAYRLRRVWLTEAEEDGYYYGFANEGLWPLCHRAHVRPVFRSSDFDTYWTINTRFADAACDEAQHETPIVLVQDYHFALAPLMIRHRLAAGAIVAFWHIPWPNRERLQMCPWASYLVEGMLGSDLVGFQTQEDGLHFLDGAEHVLGASVDRQRMTVTYVGRTTHVRAYAASVAFPPSCLSRIGDVERCTRDVHARFGLRASDRLVVGIDRMDYTKGLEEKLLAIEYLLEQHPQLVDSFVYVQIAQPSRQRLAPYRELRERVAALAERVNRRFSTYDWVPVRLVEERIEPPDVYRLLRAADVCYVGSLHDGMNLVAKEFISARDDERGVLVLSGFAGAASELCGAVTINPYDIEQTAHAIAGALTMKPEDQQHRMRRMRASVAAWDADRWGAALLHDASTLCGGGYRGRATELLSEATTVATRSIA